MKYKFYTTSEKAWDAMLEEIKNAKKSIFLEMYIFINNTPDHDFFGILKKKAENGVKIKIIVDSFGSSKLDQKIIDILRNSGIELLFFSFWFYHTHRKILVVDEKIAFLGGVNIHKFFQKWNDLHIRFEGRVVKYVIRSFAKAYILCGGKDKFLLAHKIKNIFADGKLFYLEQWPHLKNKQFKYFLNDKIDNAKRSIIIVTPYFAPKRKFMARLHQAVLRGVEVSVVLPMETDHWIFNKVNYFYMSFADSLGIKFYLQKEMNHAKAFLIDDEDGMAGSPNIDPLSFDYNVEMGVFFTNKNMVKELKIIIENWKKNSVIFNQKMYKKKWFDHIFAIIGRILQIIF